MVVSLQRFVLAVVVLVAGVAGLAMLRDSSWWILGAVIAALVLVEVLLLRPPAPSRLIEDERIEELPRSRLLELVRGTSLQLREMRYRYSVRPDVASRRPFSARVNQIKLGFVPVVITDNETDRQGAGFVAFVFDGHRFRGPGLPCAGSKEDALAHAAKCVEPLAGIEDTAG